MSSTSQIKIGLPKVVVPPSVVRNASSDNDWRYELRHEAQEIIQGLWIGPLSILRNTPFLEQNNIRVLISVTDIRVIPKIMKTEYIPSPEYSCHSYDPGNKLTNPLAIVSQLANICEVINQAQQTGVGTFIFCESGNEQSAVAAASYLIYSQKLQMIESIQHVQSKRFSISLDDAAKHNLQTFRDLCMAQSTQSQQPADCTKRSRGRDEDSDDEEIHPRNQGTQKRQFRID